MAEGLLPNVYECLKSIIDARVELPRNLRSQLEACKMVIDAADGVEPEQPQAPVRSLVDAKAAAEELRRRLQGK